jgi:hypothetical protein
MGIFAQQGNAITKLKGNWELQNSRIEEFTPTGELIGHQYDQVSYPEITIIQDLDFGKKQCSLSKGQESTAQKFTIKDNLLIVDSNSYASSYDSSDGSLQLVYEYRISQSNGEVNIDVLHNLILTFAKK